MDSRVSARTLARMLGGWRSREPAYEALADGVRVLCLDNRIAPFTLLPSERLLADALGVSRATVTSAYASLRESHHIDSVRGSGSYTTPQDRRDPGSDDAPAGAIDLRQASPPAWSGLAGIIAALATDAAWLVSGHGYDTVGDEELRSLIAADYAARGLPTRSDAILVTTGAQSAIHLIARTLLERGDAAVVETPTYPHAAEALGDATARLMSIPVTLSAGWDLDRATQVVEGSRPRLAYLMPRFQNPTGEVMAPDTERVLADVAARARTTLVVDDTTADLAFGDAPPITLFPGAQVVRVGSLSKLVWGGLRIGWIRADPSIIAALRAARPRQDLGTPILEQRIAVGVLPHLDEIRRARGAQLRDGHDVLSAELARALPGWEQPVVHGGLSLWLRLDAPLSSALVLAARERGVFLSAGARFGLGTTHDASLRLPFTAPGAVLADVVDRLADAWQVVRSSARDHVEVGYERIV